MTFKSQDISSDATKYGKLRTRDGHIISSKWISKDKTKSRNNYSIAVSNTVYYSLQLIITLSKLHLLIFLYQINITTDKDARYANAPRRLVQEEIYGEVEYFIKHMHNEENRIFAYVRKIDNYEVDNYGQIYFKKQSNFQFIEVIGIDRCVGFFKVENLFYILDREKI